MDIASYFKCRYGRKAAMAGVDGPEINVGPSDSQAWLTAVNIDLVL